MAGKFYGIGVGPGDSELLTVKAVRLIGEADVIIAPKTEKKDDSTALSIVRPYLKEKTEIVKMVFPMIFDEDALSDAWQETKGKIADLLKNGKQVVFLTLGDPMLYSTYMYVFRLLSDCGYPIETVPGINSFSAIASHLGYPLVEGNRTLTIIPATVGKQRLETMLAAGDHFVIMKVYKNFDEVLDVLKSQNLLEQAVMISNCGLPNEEVFHDLTNIPPRKIDYLSTILTKRPM